LSGSTSLAAKPIRRAGHFCQALCTMVGKAWKLRWVGVTWIEHGSQGKKRVDTRLQHCTRYKHRDHEIKNSQKWFKTFYRMHLDVVRSFRSLNSHFRLFSWRSNGLAHSKSSTFTHTPNNHPPQSSPSSHSSTRRPQPQAPQQQAHPPARSCPLPDRRCLPRESQHC
jgi:hypothetical protein